jgi:hypothetical protein
LKVRAFFRWHAVDQALQFLAKSAAPTETLVALLIDQCSVAMFVSCYVRRAITPLQSRANAAVARRSLVWCESRHRIPPLKTKADKSAGSRSTVQPLLRRNRWPLAQMLQAAVDPEFGEFFLDAVL